MAEVKKVAVEADSVEVAEAPVEGALVASVAADLAAAEELQAADLVAEAAIQAVEEQVVEVVLTLRR